MAVLNKNTLTRLIIAVFYLVCMYVLITFTFSRLVINRTWLLVLLAVS